MVFYKDIDKNNIVDVFNMNFLYIKYKYHMPIGFTMTTKDSQLYVVYSDCFINSSEFGYFYEYRFMDIDKIEEYKSEFDSCVEDDNGILLYNKECLKSIKKDSDGNVYKFKDGEWKLIMGRV